MNALQTWLNPCISGVYVKSDEAGFIKSFIDELEIISMKNSNTEFNLNLFYFLLGKEIHFLKSYNY